MKTGRVGVTGGVIGLAMGALVSTQLASGQSVDYFEGANVSHVGIVVRDVDTAATLFGEVFQVEVDGPRIPDLAFPPSAGNVKARVKIRGFTKGGFRFELIQPLDGPSPHRAFLETHGEGVQHFSFGTVNDVAATLEMLQLKGGTWTLGNDAAGYAYVEMPPPFGFTIEVARPGGPVSDSRQN